MHNLPSSLLTPKSREGGGAEGLKRAGKKKRKARGGYLPETVSKDLSSSASGHSMVPKSSTEGY